MDANLRAVLLGAACGSRSTYGVAAMALTARTPVAATPIPEHALATPVGRVVAALAALGETAGDKLPQTPSRLAGPGLPFRALTGAASGALAARRSGDRTPVAAALGAAAAVATSFGGAWFRGAAERRLGRDAWGAVAEDAVAATLAGLGTRR